MRRFWILYFRFWIAGALVCAGLGVALTQSKIQNPKSKIGTVEAPIARSNDDAQSKAWLEAEAGYQYSFPHDHASHDEYGIEWWYYTGNVETASGHRFGYQLTFFRVGVDKHPENPSRWAVRDLYMAHFAISDIDGQSFHSGERVNRSGIGWAGADSSAYRVWNEDWEARLDGAAHLLTASDEDFQLSLKLEPTKPEVIHGENGISQKGTATGNASRYYSLTRLRTSGRLTVAGESFEVNGLSWMDHEFGTSFLEAEQAGWDWFSIQLEDGRDLMLFQIRRSDGSIDSHSSGTLIDADGRATHIAREDLKLTPGNAWRSSESAATYPTAWTIELPTYKLTMKVRAAFNDQELRTTESTGVIYWEGSVLIEGTSANQPIRGRGYLEMTGYTGSGMGRLMR